MRHHARTLTTQTTAATILAATMAPMVATALVLTDPRASLPLGAMARLATLPAAT